MADSIERITIIGTGLIGASIGLALRAQGFAGEILGWDRAASESRTALKIHAIDSIAEDPLRAARDSDCILLATPVFGILDWIEQLAAVLREGQLVTDAGSTKQTVCTRAMQVIPQTGAGFLAGHPMAGKEVHGAAHADANLFRGAVWLFTSVDELRGSPLARQRAAEWRAWVPRFGCRSLDIEPARHDALCAWASHLPQMVGTALAALLEDTFGATETDAAQLRGVGGRAMHEMTRLGASPFSMWRDIAQTNEEAIAAALLALEQRLALIRENLKQPELRTQFEIANKFRSRF